MAKAIGISVSSVQRIWRPHGLLPLRVRQFKLSNDPQSVAKFRDIDGLYVDPPDHTIVLAIYEKSQIQALDRTEPGLPMKGRVGTITLDYKRHGTTTLIAALDILEGKVIGQCMKRHRHQEFIRFLNVIDARAPDQTRRPRHRRQLRRTQAAQGAGMARAPPAFCLPLHPDFGLLAQPVEGLFALLSKRRHMWRLPFPPGTQGYNSRLHRRYQRQSQALHLDQRPQQIITAIKRRHQVLDSIH
jgi:hypothetical protein